MRRRPISLAVIILQSLLLQYTTVSREPFSIFISSKSILAHLCPIAETLTIRLGADSLMRPVKYTNIANIRGTNLKYYMSDSTKYLTTSWLKETGQND